MKVKIISKLLFLFLLIFTVAGCGSFYGGNDAVGIESIDTQKLEDGSIKLTIYYTDEELTPLEVVLPKGEEGAKGNGIKDIKTESGDEVTKVIVTYTDSSMPSLSFDVPHGTEIEKILVVDEDDYEIKTDENGNEYRVDVDGNSIEEEGKFFEGTKYLKVIYTETESPESEIKKSSKFKLPQGQKGQDGNGIEYVKAGKLLEDGTIEEGIINADGSIDIQFKYTQVEEAQTINVPANKGIKEIEGVNNGNQYQLNITYTTIDPATGDYEKAEPIIFFKPIITQWLYGNEDGSQSDGGPGKYLGNVGDYYYDMFYNTIWFKVTTENNPDGEWKKIATLGTENQTCNVVFNANGGMFVLGENGDQKKTVITYTVSMNSYFYGSTLTIPTPTHPDGLVFEGWYTSQSVGPTTGKFTDLTVVNTDITLYAKWQEK